jgi:hypothetical protein
MDPHCTEAQLLIPDWGILSTLEYCRTGPSVNVAWRAGTTILCPSQLYPPSQVLRIRL